MNDDVAPNIFISPSTNPNRLMKVTDLTNSDAGFRDDGDGTLAGDPDDYFTGHHVYDI